MAPQEGGSSLGGTRYCSKTLKQIKTKLQKLLINMLKRKDIDLMSSAMIFTQNMYGMKRNKSAEEPMKGNEGDRERKVFTAEDRVKVDNWMTKPLLNMDPEELQLKAAYIVLEAGCGRGADMVSQVRRQYVSLTTDMEGRREVRIHGNVHRKTQQGRNATYKPLDVKINGQFEASKFNTCFIIQYHCAGGRTGEAALPPARRRVQVLHPGRPTRGSQHQQELRV